DHDLRLQLSVSGRRPMPHPGLPGKRPGCLSGHAAARQMGRVGTHGQRGAHRQRGGWVAP
ncbi:MAG: hypothetical protein AVDCRST_MAG88-2970, partial [uncultured Thermomicrobiales bacterium]